MILVALVLAYTLAEGIREHHFYLFNRASDFFSQELDKQRKAINASAFIFFCLLLPINVIPLAIVSRWINIDGGVSIAKGENPLTHVTPSKVSTVDRIAFWINGFIPIPLIKVLMFAAAVACLWLLEGLALLKF